MTRDDAIEKYKRYRSSDPFPGITPALLNSADVFDYINTIGMVWPYEDNQLNGVTLSLRVGDLAVYWNEQNEKIRKDIKADGEFRLKSNSIAYIQILEELRLPAYIIVRFNLRVTNTYRGLLLGTGPIVDPGFVGKINIPVHNLTNNDYVFGYSEPLIEMEFTKISPNKQWDTKLSIEEQEPRVGEYKNWKPTNDKIETEKRDVDYYLRRAHQGNSIQSSLPPIVYRMEETIKASERKSVEVNTNLQKISDRVDTNLGRYNLALIFSFVGLLGAIISIVSVFLVVGNIFKSDLKEADRKIEERMHILEEQHRRDSILFKKLAASALSQEKQLNPNQSDSLSE
jgi:deoxycytidine triphosphate deaminase